MREFTGSKVWENLQVSDVIAGVGEVPPKALDVPNLSIENSHFLFALFHLQLGGVPLLDLPNGVERHSLAMAIAEQSIAGPLPSPSQETR